MADAVIQPLEVFILDSDFKRLTGSIPYDSLIWHRRYYGVGEFQMQVRSSLYSTDWAYVYCEDRPETGIIQKVEYDDTTEGPRNGEDTIIVSGFFLEEVLNRLVFLVEESEQQEVVHIVPKPTRPGFQASKPQFKQDSKGNYYAIWKNGTINNLMNGEAARVEDSQELIAGLVDADVQPGKGIYQKQFIQPDGTFYSPDIYSSSYNYVSKDGKVTIIDKHDKVRAEYDVVGDPSSGLVLYRDTDGSVKWVNGAVESFSDASVQTYRRRRQTWEQYPMDPDTGQRYYTEYKTVEGPWMLRADLNDVTTPQDNVAWVVKIAQRTFQGNFTYDKPEFSGEVKTLTPSLSRIGDFFYKELQTVEASFRVIYDFVSDQMTFSVWRGIDRTQDGGGTDYAPLSEYTLTAGADVLFAQWDEVPEPPQPVPEGAGAPWAVFSDTWGTLYGYAASHDVSNYRNLAYVLYEYDEPVWDESGNVEVFKQAEYAPDENGDAELQGYHYETRAESRRGYLTVRIKDERPDAEIWVDRRGDAPGFMSDFSAGECEEGATFDFTKADFDAWVDSLRADAESTLRNEYSDVDNLDTGTIATMRYMYDYDLGDKVDMAVEAIGLGKTARITEVEEVYESGSAEIHLTMGEELLTTSKKSLLV